MFPGTTSKLSESTVASAATINAKTDIVVLTGTTQINTILANYGGVGFSGAVTLIPAAGAVILGTSGNILVGITMAVNRATTLIFVKSLGKWFIESGV
jgi:hypothetical protein